MKSSSISRLSRRYHGGVLPFCCLPARGRQISRGMIWTGTAKHQTVLLQPSHSFGKLLLLRRNFSTQPRLSLRNMIKPFLLKCHPDVQATESARTTNLLAIQNLNAYLDAIQNLLSKRVTRLDESRVYQVDFVVTLSNQGSTHHSKKNKIATSTSRRKVELIMPPYETCQRGVRQVEQHASNQLARLLQMAGLEIPAGHQTYVDDNYDDTMQHAWEDAMDLGTASSRPHHRRFEQATERTSYERSRERFTSSIDWKQVDKLYNQAMADLQASLDTEGMIKDHPARKREMIANMLAKVQLREETNVLEQLVALRRLSLLLEEHFEALHLEQFGRLWEKCTFVLAPARPFNTSSSSLRKRRLRFGDEHSGFSFALHPDYSVTIEIPIDFRDEELIQELNRNLWDMYDVVDDGFNSIFKKVH